MMKGNINLISYDCYQQATEKQLAGLKWKENRVYYISEIHNEKMQDEIYGYIDDRCRRLSLSTVVNDIYRFDLLKEFLNEKCTSCSSITDKKWEELERSYKAFLYKKGLALYVRRNRPDRRNVEQQSSAQISFLKMYYEYVVKCKTADIPENEKDVWDMRKLDIVPRSNPIRGRYRLDFREIRQKEFKEIIKKILYSHCQTKAMGSIKGELRGFRRFASFMYDRFPEVKHFTEISRDMIEDYLVYIKTDTGLTSVSYTTELSVLDNLLDEIGRELEIGNICNLFLSSDCRAYDNALPEAYSDAEIRRFNCALTKLKPQLGRCLIIHQMLGTRIEDTLTLRRDCLSEKSGHYFITIIQQKTRKYKRPVSNQLAELIRKAIEVSEKEHPDSEYIFLQDNGKLYTDSMLKYHVNIMIYENDIRDDNGNYFEFRTHRFRHTFGVKLTEMKLDDDSIARLLGHKDTRTIPHYRRLRNEALAEDTKAVRDEMNELLAQYGKRKMQKHDKMVALAKEKSAEMTETAITAIETMYRKNIKISVAELTKLTGLSRGFFYNNPNVKQVMMELKEKQQGMILRNPKSDAIAKAQEARIKSLEQKLSDSVPKNEYESLQKKYEELQVKYSQMKKGTLLKMYDQL